MSILLIESLSLPALYRLLMYVVVVESPAKAKTINKYLGKDYTVLASFGHVRDLPSKNGSVEPDNDFHMHYEVDGDSKKHLKAIGDALKGAETLYLATDPDREGEAISWHVVEALQHSKKLPKKTAVKRITFDEITKKAVLHAVANPRDVDMDLVNAQQARRALDYLVGFNLSPILWRKLPGSRSAGRVQSVALRLICERDEEIERFVTEEYWSVHADMLNAKKESFTARLTHYQGKKLDKMAIKNEKEAKTIVDALLTQNYCITSLEEKETYRYPAPPFTTSTLQQEAARKLGYSAKKTMQLAQKLYEGTELGGETVGLITYMRTDGVNVSQEAISTTRNLIEKQHGKNYLPGSPRMYKSKAKNAQEAHEAIRPTDVSRLPQQVAKALDKDMLRLYELIWKRLVASQMERAAFDQVTADISATSDTAIFRATGSVMKFDGFLTLYQEGKDDEEDEEQKRLPIMAKGEEITAKTINPEQHFTQPPPRYSEASLVKKLEELGIGRPSTYASILSVLQDRNYVVLEKKRFVAESRGRLVSTFLVQFFPKYVEYNFTADLENQLDDISAGEREWKSVLAEFWREFDAKIKESQELSITHVLEALNDALAIYLFGDAEHGTVNRICPACDKGELQLHLGKYGPYISCSAYPDCSYSAQIGEPIDKEHALEKIEYPKTLGDDPETHEPVSIRKGPYGFYVQRGEGKSAKRTGLFKNQTPDDIDFDIALQLLALPREVGTHPDTGKPITTNNGKYGPYLQHDGSYTSLPEDESPLTIGINRAVDIIANAPKKKGSRGGGTTAKPLKTLGEHPDGGDVNVYDGRYGPYVKHGKINATIPKSSAPEDITLEEALALLEKKKTAKKKKK